VYGEVYETGAPRRVADMTGEARVFRHGPAARSAIYAPLTVRNRTIGVLSAHRKEPDAFSDGDLNLLTVVARYLAGAIEVANLHEQLKALAATDALTGLANRRMFLDRLALEIKRVRRAGGSVVVAILDLNGFKRVNDTLGHAAGDRTLVAVALHISKQIRGTDLVARFGGDEFMLLLPSTTHAQAERVLDRLGAAAISISDEAGGRIALGFSWGIAAWPEDGDDPQTLIAEADARLYVMKQRL
jgi:diguanylate cyclase (GGDEF)-like protein